MRDALAVVGPCLAWRSDVGEVALHGFLDGGRVGDSRERHFYSARHECCRLQRVDVQSAKISGPHAREGRRVELEFEAVLDC